MNRLKPYFTFTKSERNGTVVFLLLIVAVICYPAIQSLFTDKKKTDFSEFKNQIAQFEKETGGATKTDTASVTAVDTSTHLFYFNPNTITTAQWVQLGVSEHVATIIEHYKNKGGHFESATDLKKIYGFKDGDYKRLAPYIKMEIENTTVALIDINTVDSATLLSLKGIGALTAGRIIAFRKKLGGFFKTEQLLDIYGVQPNTYSLVKDKITVSKPAVNLISVNTATEQDLQRNPYLPNAMAHAIVTYRTQHGNYTKLADIKKCGLIYDELYEKVKPYLCL